jgi:Fur family transcriptional regulator, ferric uptake regulator
MIRNDALSATFECFQGRGHRLTRPRREILQALFGQPRAVTAAELHSLLADRGVSLATVYRTLEALTAMGLAGTVARQDDEKHYYACSPDHHHHIICTRCGRVERLDECLIQPFQALVEARTSFAVDGHTLEFQGRCAACRG